MFDWITRFWGTPPPPPPPTPADLGRAFADSGAAFLIQNMVAVPVETGDSGTLPDDEGQINATGGTP
ncbi:MAG: hypothetical protein KF686_20155 [Ramlibacter sp.]|nr:hypothetical protein [Ramlibacter sp.]